MSTLTALGYGAPAARRYSRLSVLLVSPDQFVFSEAAHEANKGPWTKVAGRISAILGDRPSINLTPSSTVESSHFLVSAIFLVKLLILKLWYVV